MKPRPEGLRDDLRPEYDFDYSKAVRGKYYRRLLREGANVVVLEPDVAKAFRNSAAVNDALRSLLKRVHRGLTRPFCKATSLQGEGEESLPCLFKFKQSVKVTKLATSTMTSRGSSQHPFTSLRGFAPPAAAEWR
jgi:hypothetical protein